MTNTDGQGGDVAGASGEGGGPSAPLGPVGDGARDGWARFGRGNRAARGNPHAAAAGRLRAAMLAAVTTDDVGAILVPLVAGGQGRGRGGRPGGSRPVRGQANPTPRSGARRRRDPSGRGDSGPQRQDHERT